MFHLGSVLPSNDMFTSDEALLEELRTSKWHKKIVPDGLKIHLIFNRSMAEQTVMKRPKDGAGY